MKLLGKTLIYKKTEFTWNFNVQIKQIIFAKVNRLRFWILNKLGWISFNY